MGGGTLAHVGSDFLVVPFNMSWPLMTDGAAAHYACPLPQTLPVGMRRLLKHAVITDRAEPWCQANVPGIRLA